MFKKKENEEIFRKEPSPMLKLIILVAATIAITVCAVKVTDWMDRQDAETQMIYNPVEDTL